MHDFLFMNKRIRHIQINDVNIYIYNSNLRLNGLLIPKIYQLSTNGPYSLKRVLLVFKVLKLNTITTSLQFN